MLFLEARDYMVLLWFSHIGGLLDRDGYPVVDKWVVWFYVEPFTLHGNIDRS